MSDIKAWKKTPVKYFTTKVKSFGNQSQTYLGPSKNSFSKENSSNIEQDFKTAFPIIPFYPFVTNMNFDIVMSVSDQQYSMYEIIRADHPNGNSAWLVLDSKFNGKQFIGLPVDPASKKIVQELAKTLQIPTYESHLKNPTIQKSHNKTTYHFRYTRKDPEKIVKDRKMNFQVEVPNKYNVDQTSPTKQLLPNINNRNSHGMNHSAEQFMALIDIHKAMPFYSLSKLKFKFFDQNNNVLKNPPFNFQTILGVKVKSMIAQTIIGFGQGELTQGKESSQYSIKKVGETPNSSTYEFSQKVPLENTKFELQNIRYNFDQIGNKEELRSIELRSTKNSKRLGLVEFNPSLPDLRFKLSPGEIRSRVTISINGRNGIDDDAEKNKQKIIFYLGEVIIQNDGDGKSKVVEIRAGDMRLSHRKRYQKTPEWMYNRPLISIISPTINHRNEVNVKSLTYTAKDNPISAGNYDAGPAQNNIKVLQSFKMKWNVRSHRLSRLVVRHGENREKELNQKIPANVYEHDSIAYLEGGTWGNGKAAIDIAMGQACNKTFSGQNFYQITTKSFPLRMDLKYFPFNAHFFDAEKAELSGIHKIKIHFDHSIENKKFNAFINGIKFSTGPNHKEIGITLNGLSYEIYNEKTTLPDGLIIPGISISSNILTLYARVINGFGPELTRPTLGPWRQSLYDYSASAAMDIVLIEKNSIKTETKKYKINKVKPFRLSFANFEENITDTTDYCTPQAESLNLAKEEAAFLTKLSFKSLRPKLFSSRDIERENMLKNSRYLRSINFSIRNVSKSDVDFEFDVDNAGEVAWKTNYILETDFLITSPE